MIKNIIGALLFLVMFQPSQAQVWSQDFNAGFPSGWLLYNVDNLTPSAFSGFVNKAWVMRINTTSQGHPLNGDSVIMSTSSYSPAGQANDWVVSHQFTVTSPDMWLIWDERAYDYIDLDGYEVKVSTTGSTPADFTNTIYATTAASSNSWKKIGASLGAFNGQSVRVAFRNNSNDKFFLGLDNIETRVTYAADVKIDSIVFSSFPKPQAPVRTIVRNMGTQPITSLTLNYTIDAGAPVSEAFTALNIAPFDTATLTFGAAYAGAAIGTHTLALDVSLVNNTADQAPSNNQKQMPFAVPSQNVDRAVLMEEFSASTCHPCAIINAWLDPFMETLHPNNGTSNVNAIKYQMNYPGSGDPSYNNHSQVRHDYFNITGIPMRYLNGAGDGSPDTGQLHTKINLLLADDAHFNITGSYVIKADSLIIDVAVTPYFTLNKNYVVYIAAVERHYQYLVDTPQQEYYHVMRKMFPDASGSMVGSWTDNTPQNYSFRDKYTVGNVTKNSFNFWASPFGSDLVVFIQDPVTKEVVQSKSIPAQWPLAVNEVGESVSELMAYPNPADGRVTLGFSLNSNRNMDIHIVDMLGRTVREVSGKRFGEGPNNISINTEGLSSGVYTIILKDSQVQRHCKLVIK